MQRFLDQAKHNEEFLAVIDKHSPTNYFDWKITVTFYASLHYIKALSKLKKKQIGDKHKDIFKKIDANHVECEMPISADCFASYSTLFNLAHTSRYFGIVNPATYTQLMKYNFSLAKSEIIVVKKYCKSEGLLIV